MKFVRSMKKGFGEEEGDASKLSSVKNQSVRLVHHEMLATPHHGPRGLRPSTTPGQSTNPLHRTVAILHRAAFFSPTVQSSASVTLWITHR
jgi:hypothetical protein